MRLDYSGLPKSFKFSLLPTDSVILDHVVLCIVATVWEDRAGISLTVHSLKIVKSMCNGIKKSNARL
jgi:hypothetical protein